jgi:hypothetical protein
MEVNLFWKHNPTIAECVSQLSPRPLPYNEGNNTLFQQVVHQRLGGRAADSFLRELAENSLLC